MAVPGGKGKDGERKSKYQTALGDTLGCESLLPEATKVKLEPYGEFSDPFEIAKREEEKKNKGHRPLRLKGKGDDDDDDDDVDDEGDIEIEPLCSPIDTELYEEARPTGAQQCMVSSIAKHESVIAASRSLALVFMSLIAICACAVLAAGVVCVMQYRFNVALASVEIMVAFALFIIAACGFYAAWCEQPTYLWWSVGSMVILTAAVLAVGLGMITSRHRLESEGFEQDFKNRAKLAYVDGSETNRAYVDAIQETLQCCGANDAAEYYYLQGHFGAPSILAKETVRKIGNMVRQGAENKKPALHVQVKSAKGGKAALQSGGKLQINIENVGNKGNGGSTGLEPAALPVSPSTGVASYILPCTCCVDVAIHEHCGDLGIGKCSRVHTRGCKGAMLSSMGVTTLVAGSLAFLAGILGILGSISAAVLANHLGELHNERLKMLSSHCMAPT